MFQKWINFVFEGCTTDWHYMLCILLLLLFFDVICSLIQLFGERKR